MAFHKSRLYQLQILIFGTLASVCQCASIDLSKNTDRLDANIDLKPSSSSYSRQYYDWAGSSPGGYDYAISGNGIIGNGLDYDPKATGYGPVNERPFPNNADNSYNPGYVGQDYGNQGGVNYGGYPNSIGGYGGYGGYGGNGGLTSYYGYNNPYYQEANHLGYGYYNKKLGFGNIYSSGVTPNLVTGYRGYSRR